MCQRVWNRIAALLMIAILLFWNMFPVFAYAGEFIKPGKAITPGKSYAPGQAIQGGQFIAPGQVYEPGEAYDPGKAAVSGQPILPQSPLTNGVFIIPNVTAPLPGSILWQLNGMEQGNALQGGNPVNGGNSDLNGNSPDGGQAIDTGKGPNGGQAADAGEGPNGGQAADAGEGPNAGKAADTGNGPGGGKATESGEAPDSGKATDTGDAPDGREAEEEKIPSLLNTIIKTTDGERGWFSHVTGFIDDFKTFGVGFLNRDVGGAALSLLAGFKIEQIAGTVDGYRVTGQKNMKLFDSLYQRYKGYDVNGSDRSLGTHTKRIKEKTYNAFLQSKGLKPTDMKLSTYVANAFKSDVVDGWNPFTKKAFTSISSWKDGSAFNKAFVSKSTLLKMNGPINYALAAAGTLWDYGPGDKENKKPGYLSSDFFTDLSTEVAIGVGSSAIGSFASSVTAGAIAGSVVPGLGTIVGATVGLAAGVGVNVFLNRSRLGRNIKDGIKSGFKFIYSNIGKGLGKLGGLIGIGK